MNTIAKAKQPDLPKLRAQLQAKNILFGDALSRICAAAQAGPQPSSRPVCSGNLHIGMFFDGTGNNEVADYYADESKTKPQALAQRKHSNVVRLYHVFPDESDKKLSPHASQSTNKRYRFYIPGVGTKFPEINDDGSSLGSATGWGGEPRIIWGLIQVVNAVHLYYKGQPLLEDKEAGQFANDICYGTSDDSRNFEKYLDTTTHILPNEIEGLRASNQLEVLVKNMYRHHKKRRNALNKLLKKLQAAIPPTAKPHIEQITLHVFGFSRGAAEARAFVNWLNELCEGPAEKRTLAGMPLVVQFMGIFDTVASVGIAGAYSFSEGRQGWADDNLQIPSGAMPLHQCVHMVAAHEVRACFPMDSVREYRTYPSKTTEIIYPGSHSDVGGGYMPQCLGKDDWLAAAPNPDHQIARVPGFDMYCQAMAAGVPFYTFEQLEKLGLKEAKEALLPAEKTLDDMERYFQHANIPAGPVEDMAKAHLSYYHAWRWRMGLDALNPKLNPEFKRLHSAAKKGGVYQKEAVSYKRTQHALLQAIANYCDEIDSRINAGKGGQVPLKNHGIPEYTILESSRSLLTTVKLRALQLTVVGIAVKTYQSRSARLNDPALVARAHAVSREAPEKLQKWQAWLETAEQPEWHDLDTEREAIWLLDALNQAPKVTQAMADFFGQYVHDSEAGFDSAGFPEFEINGYGLAKFRRIYFGNDGDQLARQRAAEKNLERVGAIERVRSQKMPPPMPSMPSILGRLPS